jgi:hypothetical protein
MGTGLKVVTDGVSSTVIVSKLNHGLTTGDLVTVYTSTAVGGISSVNLSVAGVAITVLTPDTFSYSAGAASVSIATGSLDTVYMNTARGYTVGSKELEVYLNGQTLIRGTHYNEVGSFGSSSTSIQFLVNIALTNTVTYRIDANGGKYLVAAGGSTQDMQDTYDVNGDITIAPGTPINLYGTGTLLYVQADLEVDGLIL